MDVMQRNMTEALRLQPPLVMLLRKSHKTFNVTTSKGKTIQIPKGHVLATSPAFQHRLEGVFTVGASADPRPRGTLSLLVPAAILGMGSSSPE